MLAPSAVLLLAGARILLTGSLLPLCRTAVCAARGRPVKSGCTGLRQCALSPVQQLVAFGCHARWPFLWQLPGWLQSAVNAARSDTLLRHCSLCPCCSPSMAAGYWGRPDATRATFQNGYQGKQYLRTGAAVLGREPTTGGGCLSCLATSLPVAGTPICMPPCSTNAHVLVPCASGTSTGDCPSCCYPAPHNPPLSQPSKSFAALVLPHR